MRKHSQKKLSIEEPKHSNSLYLMFIYYLFAFFLKRSVAEVREIEFLRERNEALKRREDKMLEQEAASDKRIKAQEAASQVEIKRNEEIAKKELEQQKNEMSMLKIEIAKLQEKSNEIKALNEEAHNAGAHSQLFTKFTKKALKKYTEENHQAVKSLETQLLTQLFKIEYKLQTYEDHAGHLQNRIDRSHSQYKWEMESNMQEITKTLKNLPQPQIINQYTQNNDNKKLAMNTVNNNTLSSNMVSYPASFDLMRQ